ncbi:DUF4158 domain-containing protein [Streptomyces olivaceoviridis]
MTSIERTAYPRFKRLITARELHVFFPPSEEERVWAEEVTDSDEHQLALLVALKSYQRMGCFPKVYDVPAQVVEFVRRAVELRRARCRCTRRAGRPSGTGRGCMSGARSATTARRVTVLAVGSYAHSGIAIPYCKSPLPALCAIASCLPRTRPGTPCFTNARPLPFATMTAEASPSVRRQESREASPSHGRS